MAHDCNIVVGTDSLASNDSLSVMKEIQTLQHQFKWLSWEECLKWATINGARALGIDDKFGSFTKGRQPGVLHLRNGEVQRLL